MNVFGTINGFPAGQALRLGQQGRDEPDACDSGRCAVVLSKPGNIQKKILDSIFADSDLLAENMLPSAGARAFQM